MDDEEFRRSNRQRFKCPVLFEDVCRNQIACNQTISSHMILNISYDFAILK